MADTAVAEAQDAELARRSAKRELWLRLRAYQFADIVPPGMWDHVSTVFTSYDPSTKAFASKIARKHRWESRFAMRAIAEYKKFVFLGITSDVVVTPSKAIDVVWHEHLLFTRAYREFCRDVLHRDFDHHPELLPSEAQTEVYAQQYEATLVRYRREFRMSPPLDIWGTTKFTRPEPVKSPSGADASGAGYDMPLYTLFDGRGDTQSHHDMGEFGGGGGFAGGGGGNDWGGGSDSSDGGGGGDSGGDGGSGCSSGCGGE